MAEGNTPSAPFEAILSNLGRSDLLKLDVLVSSGYGDGRVPGTDP